ncbi:hypothetical protein ELI_4376 [Eubacterium callanderi]|uniref:Uncharacterized protein n=1 Tax=Eubacterium callanderi TaxID=53442 RepID=E3GQM3_9FIRM|nr:hypothetical protein ELI_4376 [Eubacterium callanderi]
MFKKKILLCQNGNTGKKPKRRMKGKGHENKALLSTVRILKTKIQAGLLT